jgi:hypothetical protein
VKGKTKMKIIDCQTTKTGIYAIMTDPPYDFGSGTTAEAAE